MRNGSFSGTGPLLIQSLSINYGMLRELTEPLPRIVRLYVASISVLPGVPKVLLRRSYFLFPPSSMYGGGRLRGRLGSIKNVPGVAVRVVLQQSRQAVFRAGRAHLLSTSCPGSMMRPHLLFRISACLKLSPTC